MSDDLSEGRSLIPDLISLHLIRRAHDSIIISYHANGKDFPTTSAEYLHERIRFAGIYCITLWPSIIDLSPPTNREKRLLAKNLSEF